MQTVFALQSVENQRFITPEKDGIFLFELQRALLLALKEFGVLNGTQCRFTEDELHKQFEKGGRG